MAASRLGSFAVAMALGEKLATDAQPHEQKPDQGQILAVGPGKRDENGKQITLDVKVGDRVLFGKYAGQTVKVDGEELLVMREEDIMGVVEA